MFTRFIPLGIASFLILACSPATNSGGSKSDLPLMTQAPLLMLDNGQELSIYRKVDLGQLQLKAQQSDNTQVSEAIWSNRPKGPIQAASCYTYKASSGGVTGCGVNCDGTSYPMSCESDLIKAWGIDVERNE